MDQLLSLIVHNQQIQRESSSQILKNPASVDSALPRANSQTCGEEGVLDKDPKTQVKDVPQSSKPQCNYVKLGPSRGYPRPLPVEVKRNATMHLLSVGKLKVSEVAPG